VYILQEIDGGYRIVQSLVLLRRNLEEQERQLHSKVLASVYVFGYRRSLKVVIWQKSNRNVRSWTERLKEKL